MQQVSGQKLNELKDSQEKIEKLSFDCINQHDIITNQVYELTSCINEIMVKSDEMIYIVENALQGEKSAHIESNNEDILENVGRQLNEQMELLITLSQQFNDMMEQRSIESQVVHDLEGMVEKQKIVVDHLLEQDD